MKKVEIETVCGEISTIYVSQDVEKITIDGEEFSNIEKTEKKEPYEDPTRVKVHFENDWWNGYIMKVPYGELENALKKMGENPENEENGTLIWIYCQPPETLGAELEVY